MTKNIQKALINAANQDFFFGRASSSGQWRLIKMPQFRFPISGRINDSSKAVTVRRFQNVDEFPVLTLCHPTTWPFVLEGGSPVRDDVERRARFL